MIQNSQKIQYLFKLATSTEYKRDMFFNTKSNPEFRVKKQDPFQRLATFLRKL